MHWYVAIAQLFGIVRDITPQLYAAFEKTQTSSLYFRRGRAIIYSLSDFRVASNGGDVGSTLLSHLYIAKTAVLSNMYLYLNYSYF